MAKAEIEITFKGDDQGGRGSSPAPGGLPPSSADWGPRFRELQNRVDAGLALTEAERRELEQLAKAVAAEAETLRHLVDRPAGPPPGQPATPQPVALTPENAKLVADLMAGRITEAQFEAAVKQPAAPAAAAPTDPAKGGPPVARLTPTAKPVTPEGVDEDVWLDLQRQASRQADQEAAADKAARKWARQQADRHEGDRARAAGWRGELTDDAARAEREAAAKAGQVRGVGEGVRTMALASGAGGKAAGLMQIAGTGALGEGAAAAAANPMVAAGLVMYDVASDIVALPFEKMRAGMEGVAKAGQQVARNDLGGLMADASEGVSAFAERTGLAGVLFAEQLRTATAGVRLFQSTVDAFVQRGRELAGYSGALAGEAARADVARIQADIREAQATGKGVSQLIRGQSEMEQLSREVMLLLKGEVVGALNEIVQPMADIAAEVRPILALFNDGKKDVSVLAQFVRMLPQVQVLRLIAWMAKFFENPRKAIFGGGKDDPNALLKDLFDAADSLWIGPPGGAVPPPNAAPNGADKVAAPVNLSDFDARPDFGGP